MSKKNKKTTNEIRVLCPICQKGLLHMNIWTIKERRIPIKVHKGKPALDWPKKIEESLTEEATLVCQNPECGDSATYDGVELALRDVTALVQPKYLAVQKVNGEIVKTNGTPSQQGNSSKAKTPVTVTKTAAKILISKDLLKELCHTT